MICHEFFIIFFSVLCSVLRVSSESPRPIRLGAGRVGGRDRDFEPCLELVSTAHLSHYNDHFISLFWTPLSHFSDETIRTLTIYMQVKFDKY